MASHLLLGLSLVKHVTIKRRKVLGIIISWYQIVITLFSDFKDLYRNIKLRMQWRIQDFPDGEGRGTMPKGGHEKTPKQECLPALCCAASSRIH